MDFTYFIAAFLAVVVGFLGAIAFVIAQGQSLSRLIWSAIGITIVLDFAFLINWANVDQEALPVLFIDLAVFTIYAMVGCTIGVAPVLALRRLLKRDQQPNDDNFH